MFAIHIKKIKHGMLFKTGVYLKDITNTFSPVLHLNVCDLSICSSCFFFCFLKSSLRKMLSVICSCGVCRQHTPCLGTTRQPSCRWYAAVWGCGWLSTTVQLCASSTLKPWITCRRWAWPTPSTECLLVCVQTWWGGGGEGHWLAMGTVPVSLLETRVLTLSTEC